MERESYYQPVEHDGDVLSVADVEDLELYEETTRAAQRLIGEDTEDSLPPTAASAYDAAAEFVDKRMDQGVDSRVAWAEADPTGEIQRNFEREQQRVQDELNHRNSEQIRQQMHDAAMVEIEKLPTEAARIVALRELLANERVAEERRGRRA